jgi:hypothetical protein
MSLSAVLTGLALAPSRSTRGCDRVADLRTGGARRVWLVRQPRALLSDARRDACIEACDRRDQLLLDPGHREHAPLIDRPAIRGARDALGDVESALPTKTIASCRCRCWWIRRRSGELKVLAAWL